MSGPNDSQPAGTPPLATMLRWLAATAGLSGLLATAGYIVHFAQEDLLGISLDTRSSAAAFALDGARFFADLGVFFLRAVPDLIVALLVVALLALIGSVLKRWWTRRNGHRLPVKHFPAWIYPTLLLLAVIGELAWHDLPAMYIQDVLFKPVEVGPNMELSRRLPVWIQNRTVALRNSIVCSRVPEFSGCAGDITEHERFLERWFSFNLVFTVFLLILGLRALAPPISTKSQAPGLPILTPLGLLLSLALFLGLFGIPFVYAKTIKPLRFLDAEIIFKKSGGAEKLEKPTANEGAPEQPSTAPAEVKPEDEKKLSLIHWYILSEGEDRLVLYNQDEMQIWSIPKEDLKVIQIVGEGDVLETHFREYNEVYGRESNNAKKT